MIKLFVNWLVLTIAIIISAFLLPGVSVSGFLVALVVAVVIAAINGFIRPVLLLLTLPINILTLGLFTFVLNALLIMFAAWLVPGFQVAGFWWALLFSILLSVVNWVLNSFKEADSS